MPSSHFNPHSLEQQYISCRAGEKRHGKEHAFEVHYGLSSKRHGHIALAGTDVTSSIRTRGHVFFLGGLHGSGRGSFCGVERARQSQSQP